MPDERTTDAEVMELRQVDADIASIVLGFVVDEYQRGLFDIHRPHPDDPNRCLYLQLPHYTTDASAAEEVVVAMAKLGLTFRITLHAPAPGREEVPSWEVVLEDCYPKLDVTVAEWHAGGTGPTAASFICRCALEAAKDEGYDFPSP